MKSDAETKGTLFETPVKTGDFHLARKFEIVGAGFKARIIRTGHNTAVDVWRFGQGIGQPDADILRGLYYYFSLDCISACLPATLLHCYEHASRSREISSTNESLRQEEWIITFSHVALFLTALEVGTRIVFSRSVPFRELLWQTARSGGPKFHRDFAAEWRTKPAILLMYWVVRKIHRG